MAQTQQVRGVQTAIITEDGWTKVIYRGTVVVKFNDIDIVLNSGGWRSHTTKTRMMQAANQFDLGFRVYQQDHSWYVGHKGVQRDFADGMILQR